jgi:ankyrin repeat protein
LFFFEALKMSLNPEAPKEGGEHEYPAYMLQENQVASAANIALFNASLNGSLAECEEALKKGAKPNFFFRPEDNKSSLHVAAEKGFVDIVKFLLNNGAEVNSIAVTDKATALILAANNDNPDLIHLLLQHGAHINAGMFYMFLSTPFRSN